MKLGSIDTRRLWLALCTMLAVGLLFSWYFLLHVPNKEEELVEKKYRALRRIGQNVVKMRDDCENALRQELMNGSSRYETWKCDSLYNLYQMSLDTYMKRPTERNGERVNQLEKSATDCYEQNTQSFKAALAKLKVVDAYSGYYDNPKISDDYEYIYFSSLGYKMPIDSFINNTQLIDEYFDRFLIVRMYADTVGKDTLVRRVAYQGTKFNLNQGAYSIVNITDLKPVIDKPGVTSSVNVAGKEYRVFSHTISIDKQENWILCGLEPDKNIRSESRSLQLIFIIFLVLAVLFVILAMPLIKLMVMSSIERLDSSNVFYLGLSLIAGTAVAFLILIVSHHYITYRTIYKSRLRAISDQIDSSYTREIRDITAQLDSFRSQQSWTIGSKGYLMNAHGLDSFSVDPYPFYNELIALNANGDALVTRATHPLSDASLVPNIGGRTYFSEANNGNGPYALQSILSRNTLRHEAGIGFHTDSLFVKDSIRTSEITVLAAATKLKSVMDPLLPPAFSFCMIDEQGEVLFHSNKMRSLQENLFDETEKDLLLDAAIKGRLALQMPLTYGGKEYAAFVRPISGKPLYLVTLYDKDYYHVPIVLTLSLALLLIAMHFGLQGIQLLLLYLTTYRSSKLKLAHFFLFWGRPRLDEIPLERSQRKAETWKQQLGQMTFQERYIASMFSMAMIACFMLIFASLFDGLSIAFTLAFMTIPVHLMNFHYWILTFDERRRIGSPKNRFVFVSLVLLFGILATGFMLLSFTSFIALLFTQLAIGGIFWLNLFHAGVKKIHKIFHRVKRVHRYALFVFAWLFMVSVLPVSFYYKVAFDRETQAFERYIQWEASTQIKKRKQILEKEAQQLWEVNRRPGIDRKKLMEAYIASSDKYGCYFDAVTSGLAKDQFEKISTTPLDSIEFYLRPPIKGPIENSRKILLGNAQDQPLKWFLKRPNILLLGNDDQSVLISSIVPSFSLLQAKYFLIVILVLAIMFAIVYKIILSGMKYIFGIERITGAKTQDVAGKKILEALLHPNLKFRIFLVGLPFSGKTGLSKELQRQLDEGNKEDKMVQAGIDLFTNKEEIDFRHYEKPTKPEEKKPDEKTAGDKIIQPVRKSDDKINKLYLLKHFEHELNDHAKCEEKLEVLEDLQRHEDVKIIIASAVEPDLIIEIYEKKIARMEAEKAGGTEKVDDAFRKELSDYRTSYRKWKNLLGGFKVFHLPIKKEPATTSLEKELNYGTYLPRLKEYFDPNEEVGEDKILEIGEIASLYYHSLWNAFSQDEKRVLFDLAKDRFVNLRDITKIRLLIKKGVVIMEDCPRIMNRSFANFILSVVKEDEELAMNDEVRRKGTWHAVQFVIVITLVSIVVFVAFVQREMLPNLNVTIGAISGLIALLTGFQRMIQSK